MEWTSDRDDEVEQLRKRLYREYQRRRMNPLHPAVIRASERLDDAIARQMVQRVKKGQGHS